MTFTRIAAFRLVTREPERLLPFYAAIGFAIGEPQPISSAELALLSVAGRGRRWPMRLGKASVDLDQYDVPVRPYPARSDAASACFQHLALVTGDVADAWERARAAGAAPISRSGPVTLPPLSGGVTAIKFRDPEGHPLELIQFPDGAAKGWPGRGMLGIDHSALVVSDLAASEIFYATHDLVRGAATLNRGVAQAMLDGLEAPVADVVPMEPPVPSPHVELLHYRQPIGERGAAIQVTDVAATRIVWAGSSPGLMRDPDGHLHQMEV